MHGAGGAGADLAAGARTGRGAWLAGLSVAVWGGMLLSDAVAFIGASRRWGRCAWSSWRDAPGGGWREAAVTAVVTAVRMAGRVRRHSMPGRSCPGSPTPRISGTTISRSASGCARQLQVRDRAFRPAMRGNFGLGPLVAGRSAVRSPGWSPYSGSAAPRRRVALAALWPEMLIISALHKYPFLDQRTSTFLFAVTTVIAAIGVAGVCSCCGPGSRATIAAAAGGRRAWRPSPCSVKPVRAQSPHPGRHGDVRDQTRYVAAHAGPADVILVNLEQQLGIRLLLAGRPARPAGPTRR